MNKKEIEEMAKKFFLLLKQNGGKGHFDLKEGVFDIQFPSPNLNSSLDLKLEDDEIVLNGSETSLYEKFELIKKIMDEIKKRGRYQYKKNKKDVMIL